MADQMSGGCACGRVRFTANIENDEAYLCHCRMCQRATGSISIAFKNVKLADIDWQHEPDWYDSSPIARRPYLPRMRNFARFRSSRTGSDQMDLTIASFDDPSRFKPKHHFGAESIHRAWLNTEGLPEYRTDEYQALVDRWVEATGEFPG